MLAYPKPVTRQRLQARKRRAQQKIVRAVRAAVEARANYHCERCGCWCGDAGHAHHCIPRSRGGKWTLENITYLCPACHQRAHATGRL